MMNKESLLAQFDEAQRINIEYPATRKEVRPHVIRSISESGGPHFILYSRLEGADIEAVIAEEQAYFSQIGEVEWKVYGHDRPWDLRQRLAARGFEVGEAEAVMILDLGGAAVRGQAWQADLRATSRPGQVTLRRLDRPSQLKDVQRIEELVWQEKMAWIEKNLADAMAIPGFLSAYVAYVDEEPACAGWVNFHANGIFADLWGGSTVPAHRGRGLYTAVLYARLKEAADRGYRFVTTDASPMSRPILARHGFELLTMTWPCKWRPG
ncbi:MAG: hypothetical protein PVH65_17025 [Chloroflexota bacterium]